MAGGRFRELLKKYGKVGIGVHMSVSAASVAGLYLAIKNNVDVESTFQRFHVPGITKKEENSSASNPDHETGDFTRRETGFGEGSTVVVMEEVTKSNEQLERNRTTELAASTGGALALAILCNKALFPIRVPITIALTPPIARFLSRRNIIKTSL